MRITLLEPYYTGSHKTWADELIRHSRHHIQLLSLPGRHWKWRMHGAAVTLARRFMADDFEPDLLLATDMLDVTTFLALTRQKTAHRPLALYFHENQITYPWSPHDRDPAQQRDAHYGFINFTSALAADRLWFNSRFHLDSFNAALPEFLSAFPDHKELDCLADVREKSRYLPLGLDLKALDRHRPAEKNRREPPLILWNHRWEYDKNPDEFFHALFQLYDEGLAFEAAILGESFAEHPPVFTKARRKLGDRIVQFGFAADPSDYARWLWRADLLPVHSLHDFFGASVVQAMYCNCYPLLPQRLAYPEHVPESSHDLFFYGDYPDLLKRLRHLLTQPRPTPDTRSFVSHYDWTVLAPRYDALLAEAAGL